MALYKHREFLSQIDSGAFNEDHEPGSNTPFAGIYRCVGCGREIGIADGQGRASTPGRQRIWLNG